MSRYEEIPVLPEPSGANRPWAGLISAGSASLVVLGAVLCFLAVADRFHDPKISYLSDRVAVARRGEDSPDVIFIGTSLVYRSIDAGYLNELAAEEGCGLSFMNLGLPGMSVAEFKLLLDTLAGSGAKPKFVVFNPTFYDGLTRVDCRRASWSNRFDAAGVAFDSLGARKTMARLASKPGHEGNGIRARLAFAKYWALSSLRAGEAAHWILRDRPGPHYRTIERKHREHAGFLALEDDPNIRPHRRANFLENLERWQARVATARSEAESYYRREGSSPLPEPDRRLQDRLLAIVRTTGGQPVVIFPPKLDHQAPLVEFYRGKLGDRHVLDFGFDRHQEFMNPQLWYDRDHLNQSGSRLLSEQLLPRFCGPR